MDLQQLLWMWNRRWSCEDQGEQKSYLEMVFLWWQQIENCGGLKFKLWKLNRRTSKELTNHYRTARRGYGNNFRPLKNLTLDHVYVLPAFESCFKLGRVWVINSSVVIIIFIIYLLFVGPCSVMIHCNISHHPHWMVQWTDINPGLMGRVATKGWRRGAYADEFST